VNPPDPLAALHPLRSPDPVAWWPPAPGWWILLATIALVTAIAAYLLRRQYRRNAYRRRALRELERIELAYQGNGDASDYLASVNALLKSVALRVYPQNEVAAIHGAQWRAFLNRQLPEALQLQRAFDEAAYQKARPDIDLAQVQQAARHWIVHHRVAP